MDARHRTTITIATLTVTALLTGCGISGTPAAGPTVTVTLTEPGTHYTTTITETVTPTPTIAANAVEPRTLVEHDGVTVSLTGMSQTRSGDPQLDLLIENNSTQPVMVQTRTGAVNGYMIDGHFSAEITPGNKANDTIWFDTDDLAANGITDIEKVAFAIYMRFGTEDNYVRYTSDVLEIPINN